LWRIVDLRVLARAFGVNGRRVIRILNIAHIKPCCGFTVTERRFTVTDSTPLRGASRNQDHHRRTQRLRGDAL
jgi:hypothetical protein